MSRLQSRGLLLCAVATALALAAAPRSPATAGTSTATVDAGSSAHLTFYLRSAPGGGDATTTFSYGIGGDVPLAGRWTGGSSTTPGVFRDGVFYLRTSDTGGSANLTVHFGRAGDVPIVGDWTGHGTTTVGVRRGNEFYLRFSNSDGPADVTVAFGRSSDLPVAGDWDGTGRTGIGVVRGTTWYELERLGGPTRTFAYGRAGDRPVVGDYDGNGTSTPGVQRGNEFLLQDSNAGGAADLTFAYGRAGDLPLFGRWSGKGPDTVGVVRATEDVPSPPPPPRPTGAPCGRTTTSPAYHHVIWIWMENHDYGSVVGAPDAPYLSRLAASCGLATDYAALTHPSLPNYEGATSGRIHSGDDCLPADCPDPDPSIFGQVAWKAYAEAMPSNCYLDNSGTYAARHNPALYYPAVRTQCLTDDVPLGTPASGNLASDLAAGTLAPFSFVTPDICNDMHDCPVATGDAWLSAWVPAITSSRSYAAGDTALFVTWDEGESSNHVATFVVAPSVAPGTQAPTPFDHYSLLRTTEDLLGLPPLGAAASAASMAPSFNLR